MSEKVVVQSGGLGFFGILTLIFVVLKLTGYITWSWFWVLSPIIFSICLGLTILTIALYFLSRREP